MTLNVRSFDYYKLHIIKYQRASTVSIRYLHVIKCVIISKFTLKAYLVVQTNKFLEYSIKENVSIMRFPTFDA